MKIETAIILCAGYGKRLHPITLEVPKPLIKIKNKSLLLNTIELVANLGIKKIKLNTYYLAEQIENFVNKLENYGKIEIIKDGDEILDTGGGIKNIMKTSTDENFLVLNPDTIWNLGYKKIILEMIEYYKLKNLNNLLMVAHKSKSYDTRFDGDFSMNNHMLSKNKKCNYIYTGCQIINKAILSSIKNKKFSMNKVWNNNMKNSNLFGFESDQEFVHLTDIEIYKKLLKNN